MKNKNDSLSKPDSEAQNTTDPQEHMQGPISSLTQDVKKEVEKNGDKKALGENMGKKMMEEDGNHCFCSFIRGEGSGTGLNFHKGRFLIR